MNNNSKMLILADSKKYHSIGERSLSKKKDEIIEKITHILDTYGDSECLIITLGIKERNALEEALEKTGHAHEVTYYKAPEMMGVSAKQRIMIAVGLANKPSNAFDVVTSNTDESKVMLWESIHCDTWQAWSRVKDPAGKETSLVFALGCTVEECNAVTTWGYERTVKIESTEERQKKKISVLCDRGRITRPIIIKCNNFTSMLQESAKHKQCKKHTPNDEKLLMNKTVEKACDESTKSANIYNISSLTKKHARFLHSSYEFIYSFINRVDAHAQQCNPEKLKTQKFWKDKPIPAYLKVKTGITDRLVDSHITGTYTIGAYQFNSDNKIKWICFDIDSHPPKDEVETENDIRLRDELAETNLNKMCNFLDNLNIPYLLEASGSPHSYHIWVFVELVDGRIARQFALDIKKEVGIECEVFPKQDKIDKRSGYGNLVKVPLATHQITKLKSRILVKDEWVDTVKDMEIEVMDISKYPVPDPVLKVKTSSISNMFIPSINGISEYKAKVRPCIEKALTMQLTKFGGNQFRVSIVREYYNSGIRDPEKLVDLFRGQSDFIYEKTKYHVTQIIKKEMPNVRCDTLQEQAGMFLDCTKCTLVKWHSLTEIEAI
jgi:hypothetical protein